MQEEEGKRRAVEGAAELPSLMTLKRVNDDSPRHRVKAYKGCAFSFFETLYLCMCVYVRRKSEARAS